MLLVFCLLSLALFSACDGGGCGPEPDADGDGLCRTKPQVCYDLWQPVCGCDGRTYGNDCNAAAAGVAVDYEGECCPADACGPALGMPNYLCEDGVTVAGPTDNCRRNADGTCGWEIVQCP